MYAPERWRKKPIEIDAMQWDGSPPGAVAVINWVLHGGGTARYHHAEPPEKSWDEEAPAFIAIDTLEGTMRATAGYWVIRGVRGEHYACEPEIFLQTYERD
jgi:hypothetical protein